MNFSTKLTILFLGLALIPIALVSFIAISNQHYFQIDRTHDHLESIANLQEHRIKTALEHYLEVSRLVSSRTQLRASLKNYLDSGNEASLNSISAILADAQSSLDIISDITITDTSGNIIASTNKGLVSGDVLVGFEHGLTEEAISDLVLDQDESLKVQIYGPLVLNSEKIGVVEVVAFADDILSITSDYSGLGKTGESVIAKRNVFGDAVMLVPLRFNNLAPLTVVVPGDQELAPITQALDGHEGILTGPKIVDYRGIPVFASTRIIEGVNWGLVAKIDQREALDPNAPLTQTILTIGALSALLIIIISLLIVRAITRPLFEMTIAARKLSEGDFTTRVDEIGNDEFTTLSRTFNQMTKQLQDAYKNLEKKVHQKTEKLSEKVKELEAINKIMIGREIKMVELKKKIKNLMKKNG